MYPMNKLIFTFKKLQLTIKFQRQPQCFVPLYWTTSGV